MGGAESVGTDTRKQVVWSSDAYADSSLLVLYQGMQLLEPEPAWQLWATAQAALWDSGSLPMSRSIDKTPPENLTSTCVIAALYLRCCQYNIWYTMAVGDPPYPPKAHRHARSLPAPHGGPVSCAMPSPSVSSIPSSIACTGQARLSSSGPRRFTSCSISLSIVTMWSPK